MFIRLIDAINGTLGRLVSWLCVLMVFLGAFNAVARYVSRAAGVSLSSTALTEAQWYLFSAMVLLGAAWTLQQDRHVRVDVLYGRLSARQKAAVDVVGGLLFLLPFCAFGVWAAWDYVGHSIAQREVSPDPGGLPRYPVKALIPAAFVLLGLQGIAELSRRVEALRR